MELLSTLTPAQFAIILVIGLVAGTLGGLLGVGGSVVMIPALTFTLGRDQHLYQASAMVANIAISIPGALRHRKAGAIITRALIWLMPAAIGGIVLGVAISNLTIFSGDAGGLWLGRVLAGFLVYVIVMNVRRLIHGRNSGKYAHERPDAFAPPGGLAVGGIMGAFAGLLGIGGGGIGVPLQQVVMRMPLRNAIANSAVIICFSSTVGATYKTVTLPQHGHLAITGLLLAALLAPTAILGGRLGATLTHTLPEWHVRLAFVALMVVAAWEMAQLW